MASHDLYGLAIFIFTLQKVQNDILYIVQQLFEANCLPSITPLLRTFWNLRSGKSAR